MKDIVLKNITDKADDLARKYNKTKENDVKMRQEFVKEVKGCKIYKTYYL